MKKILNTLFLFSLSCSLLAQTATEEVNQTMDAWHKAAATADSEGFFGRMTEDCIYIGTDKTERWKRDELKKWSAKYFERDKAWAFQPIEREVYFDSKKKIAWFNETLETWMGVCRSSGVLRKDKKKGWLLEHYHLSVTIDNDKIQGFIALINSEPIAEVEEKAIKSVLDKLFDGMRAGDGKKVEEVFTKNARLVSVGEKDGKPFSKESPIDKFVDAVNSPHEEVWDERLKGYHIQIDGNMATAWTPYEFYLGDKKLHSGVNAFHLVKTSEGWKILQITDTRHK